MHKRLATEEAERLKDRFRLLVLGTERVQRTEWLRLEKNPSNAGKEVKKKVSKRTVNMNGEV